MSQEDDEQSVSEDSPILTLLSTLKPGNVFVPEEYAPPVDNDVLLAYAKNDPELTNFDIEYVLDHVAKFKSWQQALASILLQLPPTRRAS